MLNNTDDDIDFFLSISAYSLPPTQKDCPCLWLFGVVGSMHSPGESGRMDRWRRVSSAWKFPSVVNRISCLTEGP